MNNSNFDCHLIKSCVKISILFNQKWDNHLCKFFKHFNSLVYNKLSKKIIMTNTSVFDFSQTTLNSIPYLLHTSSCGYIIDTRTTKWFIIYTFSIDRNLISVFEISTEIISNFTSKAFWRAIFTYAIIKNKRLINVLSAIYWWCKTNIIIKHTTLSN